MKNDNYLHIIKAEIVNFKGITHREIEFEGRSALIIGPNDSMKSSTIQAVMSPINSKFTPLEPVTKGEERGRVEINLSGQMNGEKVEYVVKTFFSPEHQKGRLVIENGLGQKITGGASMLQSIIGDIGFDIMEFIRMGRTPSGGLSKEGVKKQIEVLKSLLSNDDKKALYELEKAYKTKYDERTEVNREVGRIQSLIDSNKFDQAFIETYKDPIDAASVAEELKAANTHNANFDKYEKFRNDAPGDIKDLEAEIKELEEKLTQKRNERINKLNDLEKVKPWLDNPKNAKRDIQAIEEKFKTISTHNENSRKIKEVEEWRSQVVKEKEKSDQLTDELSAILEKKKSVFASSSLPIKGLEFDEDKITYKGLPLDSDQLSTANLIAIGLKIAMAYNPNLRLLVIRDGSLLDKKMLEYILKLCAEQNYQILIEMVSFERDENEIRFIEKNV